MLILPSSTSKLQLTAASAGTIAASADYLDNVSGTITPAASTPADVTTATTIDLVAAPSSGQRNIRGVWVRNKHATVSNLITLKRTDGTNTPEMIQTTLQPGESLELTEANGWQVIDANGFVKTGAGAGRLLRETFYTSGSAQTHTFLTGVSRVILELIGGGGGGGGASFASPNMGFGGGGGSGGYCYKNLVTQPATGTYTVGGGGAGGANTGGTGTTGSDTTLQIGATTYTAKGGLGGVGQTGAATAGAVLGGAGVVGTNGDMNIPGEPGSPALRLSGTIGMSGAGANSIYGVGGNGLITNAVGNAGGGYGGGGGGAAAVTASQVGGAGAAGLVRIQEWS